MDKLKAIVKSSPFIITLIYIIVGGLWIQYSDQTVLAMFEDIGTITQIQSYKGWFYVFASGVLIFFLVYQSNVLIEGLFEETRQQKDKFKATFEYAPVGIAHHKPDEKWILVNKSLCELLGYKKDELLQLPFEDFIHPDDLQKGRQLDQDIVNGDISRYTIEKRYKRKDGTYIHAKLSKSAVYDTNDEVYYLIATIEDITEQKERETQLEQTLEDKKILLGEVHHRVKNNIALMSALLELQLMHSTSEELTKVLSHFKTRLKSLSLIYENFNGVDKEPNIDFNWFLNKQINFLNHIFDIQSSDMLYQKNIQNLNLNINQAIPLGLICNEMLIHTNKHHFNDLENPFIKVDLSEKKNKVTFTVENNGKSNNGHSSIHDSESLDARIMNALVKQINGDVSLDEDEDREIFKLVFKKGSFKGGGSHNHPARPV